jgi:hypothetical protein
VASLVNATKAGTEGAAPEELMVAALTLLAVHYRLAPRPVPGLPPVEEVLAEVAKDVRRKPTEGDASLCLHLVTYVPVIGPLALADWEAVLDWFEGLDRMMLAQCNLGERIFYALGATGEVKLREILTRRLGGKKLLKTVSRTYRAALEVLGEGLVTPHDAKTVIDAAPAGLYYTARVEYGVESFGGEGPYAVFVLDHAAKVFEERVERRSYFAIERDLRARWGVEGALAAAAREFGQAHQETLMKRWGVTTPVPKTVLGIDWDITLDKPAGKRRYLEKNGYREGVIAAPPRM